MTLRKPYVKRSHLWKKRSSLSGGSVALAGMVLQLCMPVLAQPRPGTARPEMPAHFDQTTVQLLIDGAEKEHNAAILRIGYFMRRGHTELPQNEGLSLVKEALAKEGVGTKRWFILESMLGFASLRVEGASPQEGLAAYATLFDRSFLAHKVNASYQLDQAINEYTTSVFGRLNDLHLRTDFQTQEVLLKAWDAYVATQETAKPGQPKRREPDWSRAIAKSESQELILPHIEKSLNDPAVPKNYGFLKAAASVLAASNAARAIELLRQSKPLLPVGDAEETADFYGLFVNLLVQQKQLSEAISTQKEYVKQSGRGQSALAVLYSKNKDDASLDSIIKSLNAADANESEINEFAEAIQKINKNSEAPDSAIAQHGIQLLTAYLEAPRDRNVEQELRARKTLGIFLLEGKQYQEALKVLDIRHLKQPFTTSRAKSYARTIADLLAMATASTEK